MSSFLKRHDLEALSETVPKPMAIPYAPTAQVWYFLMRHFGNLFASLQPPNTSTSTTIVVLVGIPVLYY
jgi:hypothetical protein